MKDISERFVEDLHDSIAHVLQEGGARRLQVHGRKGPVTIDIYVSKASVKAFDKVMLDVVKERTGIDVVKGEG